MNEILIVIAMALAFAVGWYCGYQHYARNVRKAQEVVLRTMVKAGLRMHRRSNLNGILIRDKRD